jgi:hypothetical protein
VKTEHPSYLELDRRLLAGGAAPELDAHVASCDRCRAHVVEVEAARHVAGSPPPWLLELAATPSAASTVARLGGPDTRLRKLTRARTPALLMAAGLACAAAFGLMRAPREPAYDTTKGAPSVLVHVQHEGVRSTWDGAPLSAGDQIRLELAPEDFLHVSVFSLAAGPSEPTLLHRGALRPHQRIALDKAWQLDDAPAAERLAVVFAKVELSPAAARKMLKERDPELVRVIELELPKRSQP